jgi:membrane protease YdiL (CAAX protease family)
MKRYFLDAQHRLRNGWKVLAFFALLALLLVPLILGLHALPLPIRSHLPKIVFLDLGVLLATWICVRAEGETLAGVGIRFDARFVSTVLAGMAAGIVLLLVPALIVRLGGGFELQRVPDAQALALLKTAATMLGIALFEELGIRGYAMQRALRGVGLRWAFVLFALFFCAGHPLDDGMSIGMMISAELNLLLFALIASLAWWRTGSLAVSIGMHAGWNWMQQTLGFGVSGVDSHGWWSPVFHGAPDWLTGGAFGLEASAVSSVVLLAVFAVLARGGVRGARGTQPVLATVSR